MSCCRWHRGHEARLALMPAFAFIPEPGHCTLTFDMTTLLSLRTRLSPHFIGRITPTRQGRSASFHRPGCRQRLMRVRFLPFARGGKPTLRIELRLSCLPCRRSTTVLCGHGTCVFLGFIDIVNPQAEGNYHVPRSGPCSTTVNVGATHSGVQDPQDREGRSSSVIPRWWPHLRSPLGLTLREFSAQIERLVYPRAVRASVVTRR